MTRSVTNRENRVLLFIVVAPVAFNLAVVLAEFFGLGSHMFLPVIFAAGGLLLCAVSLAAAFWKSRRRYYVHVAVVSLLPTIQVYPTWTLAHGARFRAFANLVARSQGLVAAIRSYDGVHGTPPPSLQALSPAYLKSIPSTGMPAYPSYEYRVGHVSAAPNGSARANATASSRTAEYQPRWELYVSCSTGLGNFDEFFYWPEEHYPDNTPSGNIRRVRNWAYLLE